MSFKSFCAISTAALLVQFATNATAQEKESQWIGVKPVAKKVVIEPMAVPKKETRGEVKCTEYELVWPSIKTHKRSFVTVTGKNVRWTQEFVDGDAPVFNAIEEKFDAGNYIFRVEYVSNYVGKAKEERRAASAKRRELLKKRLELIDKGDREGAKEALVQANEIRAREAAKQLPDMAQMLESGNYKSISRRGSFLVKTDGKVAIQPTKPERERPENNRSRQKTESNEY